LSNAGRERAGRAVNTATDRLGHSTGSITRDEVFASTVKPGFNNVIDVFHVVNRSEIPVRLSVDERNAGGGIRLRDELFRLR
jgi:hypothetical protein